MFKITEYVDFNEQGRAICPSCALEGKNRSKNLALIPNTDGAYKCHRGCSPEDIRAALGSPKPSIIPTAIARRAIATGSYAVSPQKVKEAHTRLVESDGPAKQWLHNRGITDEMIARYELGITKAKAGSRLLPAITIPIPNDDGTAYLQKKRVAPWLPDDERPPEYKRWSQAGITARVWFSYLPVEAKETWLCEGEWDAMLLGWQVRITDLPVAVASFTAGCDNVPPTEEVDKLPGTVITWYDRNDKPLLSGKLPGEKGAKKVAAALGDRCRIGLVPMTDGCEKAGWDVSDALNSGWKVSDFQEAAAQAEGYSPSVEATENPLKARLVTNAQLMQTAPDYVEWLVPDLLPANELILLAAGPRAGKSLLSMLLAKSVATGEAFLDRPVTQGSVIYVRCEDAPVKIKQRQIAQGWEEDLPVYWLDRFKLSQTPHLKELATELDARLIVLDTLSRIRDDGSTESSAEMSRVIEPLQEMAEDLNLAIVLVHHTGKVNIDNAGSVDVFETIRGSSAIRATCRGSMVIAADSESYRLCAENGYGKIDLKIRLDNTTLEWKLIGRWVEQVSSDLKTSVLDYLNQVGEATIDQIFDATQIPKNSLYKTLSRLVRDEMLTRSGHRRQVVYKRSIGLIGQSDDLSDDGNADGDRSRGGYRTNNIFSFSDNEVISDHRSSANSDHFTNVHKQGDHQSETLTEKESQAFCITHTTEPRNACSEGVPENDHLDPMITPLKTRNLSDNSSNVDGVSVSSSDRLSDKGVLSDEADQPVTPKEGDHVEVLTENGWQPGIYNKPGQGSYLSHRTGKLDEMHWVTVTRRRRKAALSDIRLLFGSKP